MPMSPAKEISDESPAPPPPVPHVVIVGAGFAGLEAARRLSTAPVTVTVLDRLNHHLFQPLLYQVATAGLSPADIAAPIRHVLKDHANTSVILAEVTGIDSSARTLFMNAPESCGAETSPTTLHYDYLILATGAQHSYFGHDDWEQYAPGLKSIADATAIRRDFLLAFEAAELETDAQQRLDLLTFILVGAGPTGVEMAGAVAELAHVSLRGEFRAIDPGTARIVLIEAGRRILPAFAESLAGRAHQELERMGVEVMTGQPVEEIDRDGVIVGGRRIRSRTVIWTAGVAASPAGKWLKAEVDRSGRVKVEPDLSAPGHREIFVVGDTAHVGWRGKTAPGVAPAAIQEGRFAAEAVLRRIAGMKPRPFHYRDKGSLATVGRAYAIVSVGGVKLSGLTAWLAWLVIHIFYLIGFRNRFLVLFQWAWAYVTSQRGVRLIVTNPVRPAGTAKRDDSA